VAAGALGGDERGAASQEGVADRVTGLEMVAHRYLEEQQRLLGGGSCFASMPEPMIIFGLGKRQIVA
jgi:hypothetical protein